MAPSRFTARLTSAGANRLEANVHPGRPRAFRKHAPEPDRAMSRESQHRWAIASLLPIELGSLRPKRAPPAWPYRGRPRQWPFRNELAGQESTLCFRQPQPAPEVLRKTGLGKSRWGPLVLPTT